MKCVYINLDQAEARRRSMEAAFAAAAPELALTRFAAWGPEDVAHLPGDLPPAAKACFCSHRAAIAAHLDGDEDLFVLEDDVVLSRRAVALLPSLLNAHAGDLLFTDVGVADPTTLVTFASEREAHEAAPRYSVRGLKTLEYAGATAYIVRGRAKAKVLAALKAAAPLDIPYDLYLRRLVREGALSAHVCLPYLTTVRDAVPSQIQPGEHALHDRTVNAFRALFFLDRDLEACRATADELSAGISDGARVAGALLATLVAGRFGQPR